MSWNYRVVKKTDSKSKTVWYNIHEVYYSKDGSIDAWSENPISPHGDTPEELKIDLELMMAAFNHPVLTEDRNNLIEGKI